MQIGGDHYSKMKIQPVQFIHANNIPFIEGTIIKYVSRWKSKGGLQDLEKARHMVDMLIAYGPDEHAVYMPSFDDLTRAVDAYVTANETPRMEALIIEYVVTWRQACGMPTLNLARSLLDTKKQRFTTMSDEQITPLTERERWLMIEAYMAGMMAKKRPKPHTSPHSTALDWLEERKAALSQEAKVYDNEC